MVVRDILLAELTGGHVHLCHMSTRGSVELIRRGKDRGIRVTAEVCPHHLSLTEEACNGYNTNAKMNPPLRDVGRRRSASCRGEGRHDRLDRHDHAPHHYDAKEREFDDAPFGIVGLETAFGLGVTELVSGGLLTLSQLIERMSTEPARVFHLDGGSLRPGAPADVVVFDPEVEWIVKPGEFLSKSRNTPFAGRKLKGRVVRTLVRGATAFER